MSRVALSALVLALGSLSLVPIAGCAAVDAVEEAVDDELSPDNAEDDAHESSAESALTTAEKTALCNAIPTRPLSAQEGAALRKEVITRFAKLKRDNDALLARRGVGGFAGGRSAFMLAIYAGDEARATALIAPKLKPGFNARTVAKEIQGTSCIGRVYAVFKESYAAIGRGADWAPIEKCGRAWDSDGLHFQQALIKSGWPAPTLGLATDTAKPPGNAADVALHKEFLRAQASGKYYGTPVSKTMLLKNFLPTPGSSTVRDESMFLQLGRSQFLSVGTLRGAYHVPLVVPGGEIPADIAPQGSKRQAWLDARTRGEPFVLESHLTRAPWDATNFEIRPLREVIAETFSSTATYGSGTLLMAPGSTFAVR
jgi:hypothetical protein